MKFVFSVLVGLAFALACASDAFSVAPRARINEAQVAELFTQLDDDDYFVREKADRTLRALGQAVLPLAKAERERTRSLEVRYRLGKIVHALSPAAPAVGPNPATGVQAAIAK